MAESFVLYTEELPGFESSVVVNTLEMEATAVLSTLLKYRPPCTESGSKHQDAARGFI
jgi:hypothetical protein